MVNDKGIYNESNMTGQHFYIYIQFQREIEFEKLQSEFRAQEIRVIRL